MENVKGTKALIRRLDAVRKIVGDDVLLEDWQVKTEASAKMRLRVHRPGTAVTEGSVTKEPIRGDTAEVSVGGAGRFLEYGTRPHTPPISAIKKWAGRKGKPEIAGRVWASIRKRGTKAYPFLKPAAEDALNYTADKWDDMVKRTWNKAG